MKTPPKNREEKDQSKIGHPMGPGATRIADQPGRDDGHPLGMQMPGPVPPTMQKPGGYADKQPDKAPIIS